MCDDHSLISISSMIKIYMEGGALATLVVWSAKTTLHMLHMIIVMQLYDQKSSTFKSCFVRLDTAQ